MPTTRMRASGCTLRAAAGADASALSALAFRSKAHWGYSREFMEACRDELTCSAEKIEGGAFSYVIAEIDGVTAGFYAIARLVDTTCELEALFVEPHLIGTGVGRALMCHAIDAARARGAHQLVIQADPNAERFYRAAGGRVTGTRPSDSIPGRQLPTLSIDLRDG